VGANGASSGRTERETENRSLGEGAGGAHWIISRRDQLYQERGGVVEPGMVDRASKLTRGRRVVELFKGLTKLNEVHFP